MLDDHGLSVAEIDPDRSWLPGEGDLDLGTFVANVPDAGVRCPIGVEVFSDILHSLPPQRTTPVWRDIRRDGCSIPSDDPEGDIGRASARSLDRPTYRRS